MNGDGICSLESTQDKNKEFVLESVRNNTKCEL
ncbi:hypothetical protein T4B_7 [Trichinella pseudospiralis]|uniref:Uncharacterized protein n=1 Tax=Trichinella pseudospiralis TaxID=6337 RepID=A0A0V1GDR5_TRIPS|nr:hypothetical protein T4B_7 [Trichinella pseudospiralis]